MNEYQININILLRRIPVIVFLVLFTTSCALSDANDPVKLYGQVSDTSAKGIFGVKVFISYNNSIDSLVTDSAGYYEVSIPMAGQFYLTFQKAGFTPQSTTCVMLGGQKRKVDMTLNTLIEDAFINIEYLDRSFFYNFGGSAVARVVSNISFEIESTPSFVQCQRSNNDLILQCDSNHTSEERSGLIILKAEYDIRDTLIVRQFAGPVLRIQNSFLKDASTFFFNTPRVTFSDEIDIIAVESDISNLSYLLSEDKKTIVFRNIGYNLSGSYSMNLRVKAADNLPLNFSVTFRMYVNTQQLALRDRECTFFTSDNQFVWIYTSEMRGENFQLKQFTTSDFKERLQIKFDGFGGMSYNPYNNCLYLRKNLFFQDRYITELHLYNANSGEFVKKLTIDFNTEPVYDLRFCRNGLGVMFLGQNLLYLDSKNGHEYGEFPGSKALYDSSHPDELIPDFVATCNNFNLFLLYGQNSSGRYTAYNINPDTKVIRGIYSSTINDFVTNNSSPYAFYFSGYHNKIICQNIATAALKTLDYNKEGLQNLAVIDSGNEMPDLFCSDNSIFSVSANQAFSFNIPGHSYFISSSNDAKILLINRNNTMYLYNVESIKAFREQSN